VNIISNNILFLFFSQEIVKKFDILRLTSNYKYLMQNLSFVCRRDFAKSKKNTKKSDEVQISLPDRLFSNRFGDTRFLLAQTRINPESKYLTNLLHTGNFPPLKDGDDENGRFEFATAKVISDLNTYVLADQNTFNSVAVNSIATFPTKSNVRQWCNLLYKRYQYTQDLNDNDLQFSSMNQFLFKIIQKKQYVLLNYFSARNLKRLNRAGNQRSLDDFSWFVDRMVSNISINFYEYYLTKYDISDCPLVEFCSEDMGKLERDKFVKMLKNLQVHGFNYYPPNTESGRIIPNDIPESHMLLHCLNYFFLGDYHHDCVHNMDIAIACVEFLGLFNKIRGSKQNWLNPMGRAGYNVDNIFELDFLKDVLKRNWIIALNSIKYLKDSLISDKDSNKIIVPENTDKVSPFVHTNLKQVQDRYDDSYVIDNFVHPFNGEKVFVQIKGSMDNDKNKNRSSVHIAAEVSDYIQKVHYSQEDFNALMNDTTLNDTTEEKNKKPKSKSK